jgi:hypothetical protein
MERRSKPPCKWKIRVKNFITVRYKSEEFEAARTDEGGN